MSLLQLLKEKRTERKKVCDAAGAILTKAHGEKRSITAEERTEIEARHKDAENLKAEIDTLEKQAALEAEMASPADDTRTAGREESRGRAPAQTDDAGADTPENIRREKVLFRKWLVQPAIGHVDGVELLNQEERSFIQRRSVQNFISGEEMRALNFSDKEVRALSAVVGSSGAFTGPIGFVNQLETAMKWYGSMLQACGELNTDNGNLLPYPTVNDTTNTGAQVGENTTVASSGADPGFGVVNFSAYMFTSKTVLLPIQLIQDSAFDLESKLSEMLGIRLGRIVNTRTTTGTGAATINGIMTAAVSGATAASASAIGYADFINLKHSVDKAYRDAPGSAFMFHDNTLKAVKLLTDGNGRPLFVAGGVNEGIQNKEPDTINGDPFWINNDMDGSFSSGKKTVIYGQLKKYLIRKVRGLQMVRFLERYMDSLQIGVMAFQRYDGNLVDAGTNPVKYLTH